MKKKKLKVEIVGGEAQLNVISNFLRQIEYLGDIGATRTLKIWVDGDGSGQIKVKFPTISEKLEPRKIERESEEKWDTFYVD